MERIDFIFSYWIFAWYLLYFFEIVHAYNPKFAIIAGLIENLCILLMMFYYNTKIKLVILFVIMMIILKIIPIYTIWDKNIQNKDIVATFVLFLIYLVWCRIHNKGSQIFIQRMNDLVINNKNTLPGMVVLEKLGL